ncbi:MAG: hypothetical protein PHH83_03960 [Patescibacteria group bacterium]|nr:hypothetical protein [Patescibacteria group bacterium]
MTTGIIIGILATLCVCLIVLVIFLVKWGRKKIQEFAGTNKLLNEIFQWIEDRPQTIIHLDLKKVDLDTKLGKIQLPITASDFVVKAENLYQVLIAEYNTYKQRLKERKTDLSTAVWCIISHAGLGEIIESVSKAKIDEALTRLLINKDDDATKRFLKILAESVSQGLIIIPENPEAS